ncbi:MAG: hypothetical protein ACLQVI_24250 [Polyangiaceae bacterium]
MSTSKKPASKKSSSTKSHAASPSPAATSTTPAPPLATRSAPVTSAALFSFAPPPPISNVLTPPTGFIAATTAQFRGVLPYQPEQASLQAAIKDLGRIPNYALFVGAPPLAVFTQMLTLAGQWTDMRNASFTWDQYAATQEGNVWTKVRPLMDEFRNAFAQAQKADPTLAAQLPGLTTFLGVRSAVALKGASTKRANRKAEAAGLRPDHGQVGKQRKRAAANAALEAAGANGATASSTPVPAEAPAAPTPAPAEAATTNGAAH